MDITKRLTPETDRATFCYETTPGQYCPAVSIACAARLEQHRDECLEKLRYVAAQLIEAGLDDGASPIEQMARCAVAAAKQYAQLTAERDMWKANHDNQRNLRRMLMDRPDLKERAASIVKLIAERDAALAGQGAGWVAVKDRLPVDGRVLVFSPDYDGSSMTFRIIDARFIKHSTDITFWQELKAPPAIQPVRLCCGKSHSGPECPDGKVMCCLCFARFDKDMLNSTADGGVEDVCQQCAAIEAARGILSAKAHAPGVCYWVCTGRIPEQDTEAYAFGPCTEQECRGQFVERLWRDETTEYRAEVEEAYECPAIITHMISAKTPMEVTQLQ